MVDEMGLFQLLSLPKKMAGEILGLQKTAETVRFVIGVPQIPF